MLLPGVTFDVKAHFLSLTNLGVSGNLKVGIGTIDLGPLGKINIKTDIDGDLSIQVTGPDITATMDASFEFSGDTHKIAKFDLDIKTASLESLPDTLYQKVKDILTDMLNDVEKWANDVKKGVITGVDDVAKVLDKAYKQTAKEAATIMKEAGYSANEVASGLKSAFNASAEGVGDAMKRAGFAAKDIASGIESTFHMFYRGY